MSRTNPAESAAVQAQVAQLSSRVDKLTKRVEQLESDAKPAAKQPAKQSPATTTT